MSNITDEDKLKEVERELAMRRRVYPGLIAKGSLSETAAARFCGIMTAIAEDYRDKMRQQSAT